jgi:ABC-type amino acid transport substrate-binding protein
MFLNKRLEREGEAIMKIQQRRFRLRFALVGVAAALVASGVIAAASGASGTNTLSTVMKNKVMVVATITGNPPYESLNASGQTVGFDIDVDNYVAKNLGVKIQWVTTTVAGRVTVLETGKADATVGSFTENPQRKKAVAFSKPIDQEYVALVASTSDKGLTSVKQLNSSKYTIAIVSGGTQAVDIPQILPKVKLLTLGGVADEVEAVITGHASAAAVANTQLSSEVEGSGGKLKALSGSASTLQNDAIGLPKGQTAWIARIDEAVKKMDSSGTTCKLTKKWFGKAAAIPSFAPCR